MADKQYRIKELIRNPIGLFDRLYYLKNSLDVLTFVEKLTSKNIKNVYLSEFGNSNIHQDWKRKIIFLITRMMQPDIVVETGFGATTVAFLEAMKLNSRGHLYSIDLLLEEGDDGARYRDHNPYLSYLNVYKGKSLTFIKGDSKIELPKLFEKIGKVDLFYHDSLHTYEHMNFEYTIAYPYLKDNGILLSDDIYWNHAFLEWAKSKELYICGRVFGGVRKSV